MTAKIRHPWAILVLPGAYMPMAGRQSNRSWPASRPLRRAALRVLQEQAVALVAAYLRHVPGDERPMAVEAAVEAPLVDPVSGKELGLPLVGVMDLVLAGDTGPIIADFKSTARSSEPLEVLHEVQLSSYAYLFRHAAAQPEAGLEIRSLVKTKVPKVEFHPYPARRDGHFRRLFAVLREYLDALDSGRFNYRPGFGCMMCEYQEPCRAWCA